MNSKVWIVIPARFKSQRFPGKPLANLQGQPMINWVVKACRAVSIPCEVAVATDDQRIADVVAAGGGRVEMTSEDHRSGTERLVEVARRNPDVEWFVNVQGDEPGIEPELIARVIRRLQDRADPDLVVSAATALKSSADYKSPHVVKVVTDIKGQALYFSRAAIPFLQAEKNIAADFSESKLPVLQHLGIYGYSGRFLRRLSSLPAGVLAAAENLEQLNWLENGFSIEIIECDSPWSGIDTPEELELFASRWPGPDSRHNGI
jgi:3-deoxy-manno-octulosonate cytidylyltransferase (CMP-KDO synthetase)